MSICWLVGGKRHDHSPASEEADSQPPERIFAIKLFNRGLKGLYPKAYEIVQTASTILQKKGAAGLLTLTGDFRQDDQPLLHTLRPHPRLTSTDPTLWDWLMPEQKPRPTELWPIREVRPTRGMSQGARVGWEKARQGVEGVPVQPEIVGELETRAIRKGRMTLGLGGLRWTGQWKEGFPPTRTRMQTRRIRHFRIIEAALRHADNSDELLELLRAVAKIHHDHFLHLLRHGLEPELGPGGGKRKPLPPQARQVVAETLSRAGHSTREEIIRATSGTGLQPYTASKPTDAANHATTE